jgi:hypothetical protein
MAQSFAGDRGGGGAVGGARSHARAELRVLIGTGEAQGVSLLHLGDNALPGEVGTGRPVRWQRWGAEGCRGDISWHPGRVCT